MALVALTGQKTMAVRYLRKNGTFALNGRRLKHGKCPSVAVSRSLQSARAHVCCHAEGGDVLDESLMEGLRHGSMGGEAFRETPKSLTGRQGTCRGSPRFMKGKIRVQEGDSKNGVTINNASLQAHYLAVHRLKGGIPQRKVKNVPNKKLHWELSTIVEGGGFILNVNIVFAPLR